MTSMLFVSRPLLHLQAIISQQDSHIELQRASLTERASLPGRHRGNVLLEQEKQRTLALQREELASFHKLQSQHRQEQQRWERERERHRQQVEATEARLRQREEECRRLEVKSSVLPVGCDFFVCYGRRYVRKAEFHAALLYVWIYGSIVLICNEKK